MHVTPKRAIPKKKSEQTEQTKSQYNTDSDRHGVTYLYMQKAVALAYIMNELNMGVTLSRKVDNNEVDGGNFSIINTKTKSATHKTLDITTRK